MVLKARLNILQSHFKARPKQSKQIYCVERNIVFFNLSMKLYKNRGLLLKYRIMYLDNLSGKLI